AATSTTSATRRVGVVAATTATVARSFDRRVEGFRIFAIDVDPDSAEWSGGKPVRQSGPCVAAVDRLPDAAAGTAAVDAARRSPPLTHRRIDRLRIARRHREIVRAGFIVDEQHSLPRLAAVGGLVDSAIAAGPEERTRRRDEDVVVVRRVDEDAPDVF